LTPVLVDGRSRFRDRAYSMETPTLPPA
jgi:hypothetical protein